MGKYVALLRGINVGGKNIIKMSELKECLEKNGFENIKTYIQSGNVIFRSDENNTKKLEEKLEDILSKVFKYNFKIILLTYEQLKNILSNVPSQWESKNNYRCYIAFMKELTTPEMALKEIRPKEGIDFIESGNNVIYKSTLLGGLSKSGFAKLSGTKVYNNMTMRNYTTSKKILSLIEE